MYRGSSALQSGHALSTFAAHSRHRNVFSQHMLVIDGWLSKHTTQLVSSSELTARGGVGAQMGAVGGEYFGGV